ncbi:MAG TPA: hypothetical protein PKD31_16655, partial [Blastocatellia bacterium]|nr:hypothetical protein [Blastocatellia bacterium]
QLPAGSRQRLNDHQLSPGERRVFDGGNDVSDDASQLHGFGDELQNARLFGVRRERRGILNDPFSKLNSVADHANAKSRPL